MSSSQPFTDADQFPLIGDQSNNRFTRFSSHFTYKSLTWILFGIAVCLLISTIALSIVNAQTAAKSSAILPNWPPPSRGLLGRYRKAAVSADNVFCSEIGRNILIKGGNAVDAAIATIVCLGAMDPQSNGLGGGHFMTIYNATTGKCHVVDARETAPAVANETMYKGRPLAESQIGWKAIAVPGELHGLRTEYEHFGSGRLSWRQLLEPTIELLKRGVAVSSGLAITLKEIRSTVMNETTLSAFINPNTNDIFEEGDIMHTRTAFLKTLEMLANSNDPIADFYNGTLTDKFASEFRQNAGYITRDDFATYRSTIRSDDEIIYTELSQGRKICGPPPPSSSAVTQAIIKILDGYQFDQKSIAGNVDILHKFIEASKFAYANRSELGDMQFVNGSLEIAKNITSDSFARWIRSKITDRAQPTRNYGGDFAAPSDHGTTSITVIDDEGNAVSTTSTVNLYFGAQVASESTGIIWNCQMDDFSMPDRPNFYGYPPSPANFIRPHKKPMSSISPLIIFNENNSQVEMAIGGAGGSTIISGVSTIVLRTLMLNWTLKEAIDRPRLHNQLLPNVTMFERGFPEQYQKALIARGHVLNSTDGQTQITAVMRKSIRNSTSTILFANSDQRKGPEAISAGY